jgi:hypothetical protein
MDWLPLESLEHELRVGVGAFVGRADNGNAGTAPGIDSAVGVVEADFQYAWDRLEIRGQYAWVNISGADEVSRTVGETIAKQIEGWYLEAAWRFLPETWKTGRLANAEARTFLRYEQFDTQSEVPDGLRPNPAGDRSAWTLGVTFHPTPSVVLKADFQARDDASGVAVPECVNLGIGWSF